MFSPIVLISALLIYPNPFFLSHAHIIHAIKLRCITTELGAFSIIFCCTGKTWTFTLRARIFTQKRVICVCLLISFYIEEIYYSFFVIWKSGKVHERQIYQWLLVEMAMCYPWAPSLNTSYSEQWWERSILLLLLSGIASYTKLTCLYSLCPSDICDLGGYLAHLMIVPTPTVGMPHWKWESNGHSSKLQQIK